MIRVRGSPSFFFTLSAADLQWPDLHKHMPSELSAENAPTQDNTGKRERRQRRLALERNPHIAASYLDQRVQIFMKHYMPTVFPMEHFWYRYEWQERGSGHIHGFVWLKDAPNPDDINWDLLKNNDRIPDEQLTKMESFRDYWDKIVTAFNPFPRQDENSPLLRRHPCALDRDEAQNTKAELA